MKRLRCPVAAVLVGAMFLGASGNGVAAGAIAEGDAIVRDLSLEVPATTPGPGSVFAVFLSGDGGWAELDREVSARLEKAGVPVVGWNSRAYYWKRRTPEEASQALGRVIEHIEREWRRSRVVLVGYSRGADVLPFLVDRLPPQESAALAAVVLLGPGRRIDFQFHLTDYLGAPNARTSLPVVPEIERLTGTHAHVLAVCGRDDALAPFTELRAIENLRVEAVAGDHHFAKDYAGLARLILEFGGLDREGS